MSRAPFVILFCMLSFALGVYLSPAHDRSLEVRRAEPVDVQIFDEETTKALQQLKESMDRRKKADEERQLMQRHGADCWTKGSPAAQAKRVMEILSTPNEPDKVLQ